MKSFTFEIDGKSVAGVAALKNGMLWAHVEGQTFVLESSDKRSSRRGSKGGGNTNPNEIVAPMPGKIVKIMAKPGAEVQAHEVLVVMEAMKMEYTLKAHAPGKVAEVKCAPGDLVPLGQLLVKLDPK